MLNILDGTMIVFAVLMLIGGWYVYKLARLSEAWQSMWIYFGLFLLFLPGSRIVNGILYETCPSTILDHDTDLIYMEMLNNMEFEYVHRDYSIVTLELLEVL